MILKTINVTVNILVALSIWCAAVMFAVFTVAAAQHLITIGGFAAYHWMHS